MEQTIYEFNDLKLILRDGQHFVRYDAGAHQIVMREDPISVLEAQQIQAGRDPMLKVLIALQNRLQVQGIDPYKSNWPQA